MNPSWLKNHDVRSFAFKLTRTKYCIFVVCDVTIRDWLLVFDVKQSKYQGDKDKSLNGSGNQDIITYLLLTWLTLKVIFRLLSYLH